LRSQLLFVETPSMATYESIEEAEKKLEPFLHLNPLSKVIKVEVPEKFIAITRPWGDESIQIRLPLDPAPLVNALNNIHLPERFTALWHDDTKEFEVIFTAYPLRGPFSGLENRAFTLEHNGRIIACKYGQSSDALLMIAEHFTPIGMMTATFFRNLLFMKSFILAEKGQGVKIPDSKPISFWIKGIESWNEDIVLDLVNHLNFLHGVL
jgi:hypothetical protein